MGELLDVMWQLKKSTVQNVSTELIDQIYAVARQAGSTEARSRVRVAEGSSTSTVQGTPGTG